MGNLMILHRNLQNCAITCSLSLPGAGETSVTSGIPIACQISFQDAVRGHCHCLPGAGQRRRMSPPLGHPEVKQMDFSLPGAGETGPSCSGAWLS